MYSQTNYTYTMPTGEPSNQKQESESTRQCRCHKPHSLRTSLWPTRTALPSCPASGAANPRQRQLYSVHSASVQRVSSSPVLPRARRAACTDAIACLCTEAAHKHTDMQASSTSNEAVLGLQHSAASHSWQVLQPKPHRAFSAALLSQIYRNGNLFSYFQPKFQARFQPQTCVWTRSWFQAPQIPSAAKQKLYMCGVLSAAKPPSLSPSSTGCSLPTRSADAQHLQPFPSTVKQMLDSWQWWRNRDPPYHLSSRMI